MPEPDSQAHYDTLLGPIYSWMAGGPDAVEAAGRALVAELGLTTPVPGSEPPLAVDLGCGPGGVALALADAGYEVLAIDHCRSLLEELETRRGDRRIHLVEGDLRDFPPRWVGRAPWGIACLGDTLTHLASHAEVEALVRAAAVSLSPGGWLALAFRDYSDPALTGETRFIPVRSDDRRLLTCGLQYGADSVAVHDLLHERAADGTWVLRTSTYRKLRLAPSLVEGWMREAGLTALHRSDLRGMVRLVGRR